jgi:hypothetical protein
VRSYDVAGSHVLHLLETYGPARVRRWYTGTPAREALGTDAKALEASWRKMLSAYEIRPEVALLLRQLAGETVTWQRYDGIPRDVLGEASDWTDLTEAPLRPGPAEWTRVAGSLQGRNTSPEWAWCEVGERAYEDCAVRVRVLTPSPVAVQVRLGADNQVMLVNGVFLYRGDTPVAASQVARMDAQRHTTDLLVVRRASRIRVWVDGRLALEAPSVEGPARPGVGVHTGQADFQDLRVRALPRS